MAEYAATQEWLREIYICKSEIKKPQFQLENSWRMILSYHVITSAPFGNRPLVLLKERVCTLPYVLIPFCSPYPTFFP